VAQGLLEHCTIILSRYQTYSTSSLEGCGTDTAYAARPELSVYSKAPRECSLPCGKGTSPQAAEKIEVRAHAPCANGLWPRFDFPPASLNNGPTQAPYPGW
jgi:hypothetical protein